jgi:hypothetical protein
LQVLEQLDAQVLERALADPVDEVGLQIGSAPVDERRRQEGDQDERQSVHVLLANALVDGEARQVRRHQRSAGGEQQCEQRENHPAPVGIEQLDQVAQLAEPPRLAANDAE